MPGSRELREPVTGGRCNSSRAPRGGSRVWPGNGDAVRLARPGGCTELHSCQRKGSRPPCAPGELEPEPRIAECVGRRAQSDRRSDARAEAQAKPRLGGVLGLVWTAAAEPSRPGKPARPLLPGTPSAAGRHRRDGRRCHLPAAGSRQSAQNLRETRHSATPLDVRTETVGCPSAVGTPPSLILSDTPPSRRPLVALLQSSSSSSAS